MKKEQHVLGAAELDDADDAEEIVRCRGGFDTRRDCFGALYLNDTHSKISDTQFAHRAFYSRFRDCKHKVKVSLVDTSEASTIGFFV